MNIVCSGCNFSNPYTHFSRSVGYYNVNVKFKEMITEAIKALKSDTEWAEQGNYYLALTFLFDMVDTELSSEFNIAIGNQMLVAYAELGNLYAIQFIATAFES